MDLNGCSPLQQHKQRCERMMVQNLFDYATVENYQFKGKYRDSAPYRPSKIRRNIESNRGEKIALRDGHS